MRSYACSTFTVGMHATPQQLAKHGVRKVVGVCEVLFLLPFPAGHFFILGGFRLPGLPVQGRWNVPHTTCQFSCSRPYGLFLPIVESFPSGSFICVGPTGKANFLCQEIFAPSGF